MKESVRNLSSTAKKALVERLQQGSPYAVLEICTKEELDPIVTVLTSKITNSVEHDENYKRYQPDHTKYVKLIVDEIRLYGGNSFANAGRGGVGPEYLEIVEDVCKKLSVPYTKGDIVGSERNLIDIFFQQRWQIGDDAGRDVLSAQARESAHGQVSNLAWLGKAMTGVLLPGPAGFALFSKALFDPSYGVTVPCVLQISLLRERAIDEIHLEIASEQSGRDNNEDHDNGESVLTINDGDSSPTLDILSINEPNGEWYKTNVGDKSVSRLSAVIQAIPSTATAVDAKVTRYYRLVSDIELSKVQDTNLVYGVARESGKEVSEWGRFADPNRLKYLATASAAMNLASIALAQKHLADITEKLTELKDAIDEVSAFQQDERESVLIGSVRYFEQVAPGVLDGELENRVQHQIEKHEADLMRVQEHIAAEIRRKTAAINSLKDEDWFGTKATASTLAEQQRVAQNLCRQLLLCIRARALGWQLISVFPGGGKLIEHRRDSILAAVSEFKSQDGIVGKLDSAIRTKISGIASSWWAGSANERKLALAQAENAFLVGTKEETSRILDSISAADQMRAARSKPMALALKIEDGQVTAIQAT